MSNDKPYSGSLFRTVKYRPDYPSRPFSSKAESYDCVASFVDWQNHWHHNSGIDFVTTNHYHSGRAVGICR